MSSSATPFDLNAAPAQSGTAMRSLGLRLRRYMRLTPRIAIAAAAIALIVGFLCFSAQVRTMESAPARRAEGIVVLTGGAERIADAMQLLAQGVGDRLLITGVNERTSGDQLTRAARASRWLIDCCVDLGYAAHNTAGNARETSDWARLRSIERSLVVVTSNYHMPRALLELRRAMPRHELIPYPVVSERQRRAGLWRDGESLRLMTLEYFKYIIAYARSALG